MGDADLEHCASNGGEIFADDFKTLTLNTPENIQAFQMIADLMLVHHVMPAFNAGGDVSSLSTDNALLSKKVVMPIERMIAHPFVSQLQGRVALQRGPLIYCVEGVDHHGAPDPILASDPQLQAEYRPALLGGVVAVVGRTQDGGTFCAVPHYAWDNRKAEATAQDRWRFGSSRPRIRRCATSSRAATATVGSINSIVRFPLRQTCNRKNALFGCA